MKLYYARYTRSTRPRWLLEEAGAPYTLHPVDLKAGEQRADAYLAVHPHGVVPALDDDGVVIYESAAILLHLADRFPEAGLAPAVGTPERARYYQWIVYGMVTLEAQVSQYATHTRFLPEDKRVPRLAEDAQGKFRQSAANLTRALDGREFLLDGFSAADIVVGSVLLWAKSMGLTAEWPVLTAYAERLSKRPAYRRATAD